MASRDEHGRAMLIVDNGGGLRMRRGDGERDYMIPAPYLYKLTRLSPDTIAAEAESHAPAADHPEDVVIGYWDKLESWTMTEAHESSATGREFVRWVQNIS